MARRIRKSHWSRSFQNSLAALTRATLRAGTRAAVKAARKSVKQAVKQAVKQTANRTAKQTAKQPVRRAAAPVGRKSPSSRIARAGPGDCSSGVALGPAGARRYRLYKPPGACKTDHLPLLVMLHGCGQDAAGFARSTRLNTLAARGGFFVLWPEQDRLANPQGCWNWYDTRSGRALQEAASIVAAIEQVCTRHGADPARVAVAGLSAGASLAALLAMRYPERFRAVAMHSGIAPGAAHSMATALAAMQGRRPPGPLPAGVAEWPALLVIQGTADPVVRASNGRAAAQVWADATGAAPTAPRTVQRGQRRAMTVVDYKLKSRTVASLCEVAGLGHAWSGGAANQPYSDSKGPDASRMIWAFAAKQFP